MPLLESLIGLTQRSSRREPSPGLAGKEAGQRDADWGTNHPRFDGSLTAVGEDTWTRSGPAVSHGTELALGRKTATLVPGADGARRECGNVFCRSVWTPPWKSRERPIFEGRWACSPGCAEALVRSALTRETGDWPEDDAPVPHRHRIPLGLVLLAHGWITHANLQRALEAQRASGFGRIGEWLVAECGVGAEEVTRGLSAQWNCPVLTVDGFSPQTTALALPRVLIEEYEALPLRVAGGRILYVGFRDQLDAASSFAMEQMSGLKTESGVMGEANFRRARERLLESRFPSQSIVEETDRDTLAGSVAATIERTRPAASRLLKLHRYYWLRVWNNAGECRPGSTLPMSADAVSDYLFTIARHIAAAPRHNAPERPFDAWPADARPFDAPLADERFEARFDVEPNSEPEAQADSQADAQASADYETTAAGPIEAAGPVEIEVPVAEADLERNVELEVANNNTDLVAEAAERKTGREPVGEPVGEPTGKLRVEEAALTVFKANTLEPVEPKKSVALSKEVAWVEAALEEQTGQLQQTQMVEAVLPVEGEYLPLEPLPDENVAENSTGFLSLHRRSDWRSFQVWTQRNLSFLRRGANPASDPDREG